jgi:hypothetical protein
MEGNNSEQEINQLKREFMDFLESDNLEGKYIEKIKSCINERRYCR